MEPMDILPVYPEPTSKDDFWLFVVTNAETCISGRWFEIVEDCQYKVTSWKDKLMYESVMRLDTKLGNFFVLRKRSINDNLYVVSTELKEHRSVIHLIFPLNFKFIGYVLKSKPFKVGIQGFWVEL